MAYLRKPPKIQGKLVTLHSYKTETYGSVTKFDKRIVVVVLFIA